ncbi:MAG TPA: LacI family DNA-binding transcriptional regulator [Phycisphaeraceae bacterium]
MATVREIANHARVSPATVSLVLNGRGSISAETERRVRAVAERFNYRLRTPGRPRADRESTQAPTDPVNLLVVYAPRVATGPFVDLVRTWVNAIREHAVRTHAHLSVVSGTKHYKHDLIFEQALEKGDVDGLVLIGVTDEDGYMDRALASGMPVVAINRIPRHGQFSSVGVDFYGAGTHAIDKLVALGHRRIALVTRTEPYEFYIDLKAGAVAGLAAHRLEPVCMQELADLNATDEQVQRVCRAVIESGATAAYITGDIVAVRCADAWADMGVRIPRDLSIIGFDDMDIRSRSGLRLTSIGYDKRLLGTHVVRILLDLIEGKSGLRNQSVLLETYVVDHDTTAPPRASALRLSNG